MGEIKCLKAQKITQGHNHLELQKLKLVVLKTLNNGDALFYGTMILS